MRSWTMKEAKDWKQWKDLCAEQGVTPPLYQGALWSKVLMKLLGNRSPVAYVSETEQGAPSVGAVGYRYPLPFGYQWLYLPRGPLFFQEGDDQAMLEGFLKDLKKHLPKKTVWVRFDPAVRADLTPGRVFRRAHKSFHPRATLVVNIEQEPEQILAQMKQKGRYNIKVAQKKGVHVSGYRVDKGALIQFMGETYKGDPLKEYAALSDETAKRDGFAVHNLAYFEHLLQSFEKDAFLLLAHLDDKVIAGGIFLISGTTCLYYYGASSNNHRNTMAPYLLQWEAMQFAKKRGCHSYDFLGITSSSGDDPSLAGVTSFKKKFGGTEVLSDGTFEMVTNPLMYFVVRIAKALTK